MINATSDYQKKKQEPKIVVYLQFLKSEQTNVLLQIVTIFFLINKNISLQIKVKFL